jgi:hypothetical protein
MRWTRRGDRRADHLGELNPNTRPWLPCSAGNIKTDASHRKQCRVLFHLDVVSHRTLHSMVRTTSRANPEVNGKPVLS